MRFLSLIATILITLPLTALALSFALSNRAEVTVSLWPLKNTASLDLGVIGALFLGIGFLGGAVFVSLFAQRWRYRAWQQTRRADRLAKDLAAVEAKLAPALPVPPATDAELLEDNSAAFKFS